MVVRNVDNMVKWRVSNVKVCTIVCEKEKKKGMTVI